MIAVVVLTLGYIIFTYLVYFKYKILKLRPSYGIVSALSLIHIYAVPRTVSGGERALYHALYPARHALYSSDLFAQGCGLPASPLDDLIAFHTVFGKTVPDVSLNAVANLGYAEGRWLLPVWPGDTLRSESTVIGLKQNSNGQSGVVYVRTQGINQHGQAVLDYVLSLIHI